ncbi:MAG: gliding motility-associated C-terminal domain-containing protein [Bacteroidia bacterium]
MDEKLILKTTTIGDYLWNTGVTAKNLEVSKSGLYWLELSQGKCKRRDSILIKINPLPTFKLSYNNKICEDSVLIQPESIPNGLRYQWNIGDTSKYIYTKLPGSFILKVTDTNNCEFSDTAKIIDGDRLNIPNITSINKCIGINANVELPLFSGQEYQWYDQTTTNKKLFTSSGAYWFKVSTNCGDSIINFFVHDSNCTCRFWIPNVFSPNGDQINDHFKVESQCPLFEFNLKIYSRWGELLFETHEVNEPWDGTYKGKAVPLGVYMYTLEFRKDLPGLPQYTETNGTFLLRN